MKEALNQIKPMIHNLLIKWTQSEQKAIINSFVKEGDEMPKMLPTFPNKSRVDVLDFYLRSVLFFVVFDFVYLSNERLRFQSLIDT